MRTRVGGDKGPGRSGRRWSLSAPRAPGRHRGSRREEMGVTARSLEKLRGRETGRLRDDGSIKPGRRGAQGTDGVPKELTGSPDSAS